MAGPVRRVSTPSKPSYAKSPVAKPQPSTKRNSSLLNFFQKADGRPKSTSRQARITQFTTGGELPNARVITPRPRILKRDDSSNAGEEGLFLEDKKGRKTSMTGGAEAVEKIERARSRTPDIWGEDLGSPRSSEEESFKENGDAVKRRKIDSSETPSDTPVDQKAATKTLKVSGPFIDQSDSEDEGLAVYTGLGDGEENGSLMLKDTTGNETKSSDGGLTARKRVFADHVPPLVREDTSHIQDDEYPDFDDIEDEGGEECSLDTADPDVRGGPDELDANGYANTTGDALELADEAPTPTCPVCQGSLEGLDESGISTHVNDCLDGKPSAISPKQTVTATSEQKLSRAELAAVARPAQRDPFQSKAYRTTSAFSKLMAGNAEDNAWVEAAASDAASRGKQAYQRTCPFYKIITGFSISVDAFRYGAVEGCNAYFLSHFHSDHYMGLNKSWRHGPIYCSKATGNLVRQQLRVDPKWVVDLEFEKRTEVPETGGVQVTMIEANHCPGSAIFLFEKVVSSGPSTRIQRVLHCGDFRASPQHVRHPLLRPDPIDAKTGKARQQRIDACYLDTTYLSPRYAFPRQTDVINACAELCVQIDQGQYDSLRQTPFQTTNVQTISKNPLSQFLTPGTAPKPPTESGRKERLLVVIGTYSIGKERICLAIARALKSKIFATPAKQRVCTCLEDPELSSLLTEDPLEAQVHMQTLFEIRAETLCDYLDSMKPHFTRVVGFRPTGWTYRPPAGRTLENPPVSTVLHSEHWKTPFSVRDLKPQRGSTRESACFGVPYSEHSSFRELTMFCCALRIGRIIPTVNVGSQKSRERMKAWFEKWEAEKRKNGLYKVEGEDW